MRLPSGYESGDVAGATFIARRGLESFVRDAIESAGSLDAFASANAVDSFRGRGETHVIESPAGRLVVRHYRRGGDVASVLGDRYARTGRPRPFRELHVSAIARTRGVSTPAVAVAVVYPAGFFYRADLATDYIPEATTLAETTFGGGRRAADERRSAWRAAGQLVRTAALAGLVHADLNLRNVLIAGRSDRPVPYLLDLDRCKVVARVSPRALNRMKARLARSAMKLASQTGESITAEFEAFEEGVRG